MQIEIRKIDMPARFRKTYDKVEELAKSFEQFGQLQAIVLTEDMKLAAGGRRLAAANQLGWTHIEAVVIGKENDELHLREIELEENIQREDMTWQEQTALIAEIDRLKRERYGSSATSGATGWNFGKTAEVVGKSASVVSQAVQLDKAMQAVPELANSKSKSEALKKMNKLVEQLALEELAKRRATKNANEAEMSEFSRLEESYRIGDCIEGMKELPDNGAFTLAEVDPPYGINLPRVKATATDDSYIEVPAEHYPAFILNTAAQVYRVLAPNSWCVWWTSVDHMQAVYLALSKVGFKVDKVPAVWTKDRGQVNHPNKSFAKGWEQFYLARKGNPVFHKQGRLNVFSYKHVTDRIHDAERPIALIEDIITHLLPPGHGSVLCPFLGSGNTIVAAWKQQHPALGWDIEGGFTRSQFLARAIDLLGLAPEAEEPKEAANG